MWVSGNPGDAFGCVFHLPRKHPQLQPSWEEGTDGCLLGMVRRALNGWWVHWYFYICNSITVLPLLGREISYIAPVHPPAACVLREKKLWGEGTGSHTGRPVTQSRWFLLRACPDLPKYLGKPPGEAESWELVLLHAV